MWRWLMMITHKLQTYLDLGTLVPTNTQVGSDVASSEWWTPLSNQFDDLIWLYYSGRNVFLNQRFNPEDAEGCRSNIRKTFGIFIKSKYRQLEMLWQSYVADYNPLWNVDGVEGFISKDTHTGTDTNAHSGHDKTEYEDNGSTTRSGNEVMAGSGNDTTTDGNTTFNSSTFFDTDKSKTDYGKTDTHTYNNVADTKDLDGYSDTTYNSTNTNTKNLQDDHIDLRIRQGNIGVTKSTDLLESSTDLWENEKMDFYKYVVRMCVNQVSYAVE